MKISTPWGHAGGAATTCANLGPPRISETIRARTLKFYTHLDRTKCSFRAWQFPLGSAGGASGGRPGGLKLQCPAIATFSSLECFRHPGPRDTSDPISMVLFTFTTWRHLTRLTAAPFTTFRLAVWLGSVCRVQRLTTKQNAYFAEGAW